MTATRGRRRHARARQALRIELGAPGLLPLDPGGRRDGARGPERRRQDDAAAPRDRARRADDGRGARPRPLAATRRRKSCCRWSGSSPRIIRSTAASGSASCSTFGRKLNPSWDDGIARERLAGLGHPSRPEGRHALGRPAGAGRADARPREAARGASAGRARCLARPPRTARLPRRADGGRRRGPADGGALVAHRLGARARLRPPRDPGRRRRQARRRDRRGSRLAPAPHRPARTRRPRRTARRRPDENHGASDDRPRPRRIAATGTRWRATRSASRRSCSPTSAVRKRCGRRSRSGRSRHDVGDGVIWVTWRQQRTETLITGLLLVLAAVVLVPPGSGSSPRSSTTASRPASPIPQPVAIRR